MEDIIERKSLKEKLDEIDDRTYKEVFDNYYESRLKVLVAMWDKGGIISAVFRGVKTAPSYRQLSKETSKEKREMKDEKKTEFKRGVDGKFKRKEPEEPATEGSSPEEAGTPSKEPRITTRVTGQSTKLAAIQTHNLKFNGIGEPLPELIEGEDEDE